MDTGSGDALHPQRPLEKQRLHASFQEDKRLVAHMVALDQHARSERVDAILELKNSIDASSARLQTQNAVLHRRATELADQEKRTYSELLGQGKNPHEVARRARVTRATDKERRAMETRIQSQQIDILQHLEVEKVLQTRRERLEREKQAFEKKYQAEMGRSAVEARTKSFLLSRTGKEQLDPTGKLVRVYPSQETTLLDRSFGLGRNLVHDAGQRQAIVDKVHAKRFHHDAVANPMLVPRQSDGDGDSNNHNNIHPDSAGSRRSSNNSGERGVSSPSSAGGTRPGTLLSGPTLPIPGRDLREVNHRLLPVSSADILPPIQSHGSLGGDPGPSLKKKGFGKPKRSVLEQQMLTKAREKQKSNIFQKHVVWGKEFTGDAFLSDPPVLWFKDFDVGVPLTVMFTLTNVSSTFNHFKLMDLEDETLRECFEVAFEKPGRMSAGMSCAIRMSFTAIAQVDVDAFLPVVAQTGKFQIPIRCTCKKAVPVLTQQKIRFKDVVAGEKKTIAVVLENQGALPLRFSIQRVDEASTSGGPEVDAGDENQEALGVSEGEIGTLVPVEVVELTEADSGNPNDATEAKNEAVSFDEPWSIPEGSELGPSDAKPGFSTEEKAILEFAKTFTVYRPEGSETPLRHTKSGVVAPYSSSVLTFTFSPATPVNLTNQVFAIEFIQEDLKASSKPTRLPSSSITVSAESSQVLIFTAEPELHLGCCVYEKLYRHQLEVCNRGKVALKIQVRVPKALDGMVEFTPNMGYVQALGKFVVQVKFRPQPGMWKRLERKGFGSESLGFMAVPVQVIVPDQVVPVFFLLVARLTASGLIFSMDRIDFGTCPLGHSVSHKLTIENSARLPQHFGFFKLPQEVKIDDPGDGVGVTLLPFEKKTLKLIYQPSTATPLRTKLCVRTSLNKEYFLPCAGSCTTTPLVLSHNFVQLGATQLGQSQSFSVLCSNVSEKAQSLELLLPEGAKKFLCVTPLVSRVEPNAGVRIEIVFAPTEEIFAVTESSFSSNGSAEPSSSPISTGAEEDHDMQAEENLDAGALGTPRNEAPGVTVNHSRMSATPALQADLSRSTTGTGAPWQVGIPQEDRSVHHRSTILCFRRSETSSGHSSNVSNQGGPLLSLQVETTTIDPQVFATPAKLDYSQVAIGQSLIMELTLTNNSSKTDMLLSAKPLHVFGGFRLINSLRPIKSSGGLHIIKMEFKPQSPIIYEDELELSSPSIGTLRIPLRGEGINPSLSFQPADGWLDFKDVLARNRAVHELVLSNASSFPLTYAIVLWPESSESVITTNGLPVFTFLPSEALIPAQGSLVVKVAFNPVLQRPEHYRQQFRIKVPNESEKHVLTLSGRCWEDQVYLFAPAQMDLSPNAPAINESPALVAAPVPPPVIADPFDLPPGVNLSALSGSGAAANPLLLSAGLRKAQQTLTLTFNDGDDDDSSSTSDGRPLTQQLLVGSTLPPSDDETHLNSSQTITGKSGASAPSSAAGGAVTAGSFELVVVENAAHPVYAKLFSLEPMKGALSAGQQLQVSVTYSPPVQSTGATGATSATEDAADAALRERHRELVVSQWIDVQAVCTLRGGFLWRQLPPSVQSGGGGGSSGQPAASKGSSSSSANDSDVRTVHVTLRAKMKT